MKHAPTRFTTMALALVLVACAGKSTGSGPDSKAAAENAPPPSETPPPEPDPVDAVAAPALEPMPAEAEPPPAPAPTKDILETAAEFGNFSTLLEAVAAAGLTDKLKGPGPFTLFAPDDEAFAKLPPAERERLLKDKKKLTTLLEYHVVSGNALEASELAKMPSASTVAGPQLAISVTSGSVKLNEVASVRSADIKATNGIIHVIDTVLKLPKKGAKPPAAKKTPTK